MDKQTAIKHAPAVEAARPFNLARRISYFSTNPVALANEFAAQPNMAAALFLDVCAVNAELLEACEAAAAHFKDTDAPLGAALRAAIAKARP